MSIKLKLIIIMMTIFALFCLASIMISIDMLNKAIETGQTRHASRIIGISVDLLRKLREKEPIPGDSLAAYEKGVLAALSDYKQRQVCKDDLLRKLVGLLILNAIPFFILGYFAIAFSISRTVRPVIRLTKNIARYPDLTPESLPSDARADKEIRLLTDQFRRMLENIELFQRKLRTRSKLDGWMEMSRAIVHEVGNAIAPARNSIDNLKKEIPENGNVSAAAKSIARMEEIFRHIRRFYGSREITRAAFNIAEELRFLCKGFDVEFSNPTQCGVITVFGGKTECIQLFTNLIKNAVEASEPPAKSLVRVEINAHEEDIMIAVSDNGRGIAKDAIDAVFSPGYSTKADGLGIGLAIVEKIITLHEWSISVDSKPGEGTRFTIVIPKRDIRERIRAAA